MDDNKRTITRIRTADGAEYDFPNDRFHPPLWKVDISVTKIGNAGNEDKTRCNRTTLYYTQSTLQEMGVDCGPLDKPVNSSTICCGLLKTLWETLTKGKIFKCWTSKG